MCSGSRRKHSSREVGLEIIKGLLSISHHIHHDEKSLYQLSLIISFLIWHSLEMIKA